MNIPVNNIFNFMDQSRLSIRLRNRRPVQKNIFGKNEPARKMIPYGHEKPNGYADKPGTGPAGESCKTCKFNVLLATKSPVHKCFLMRAQWDRSALTDIRVKSPACSKWEGKE